VVDKTGKRQNRKPTPRQEKAAKLMAENIRSDKPKSKGDILREAGYSEDMAVAPNKVIDSPTFQELLNSYLPDEKLTQTHKRLLETRKIEHMVFPLEHQNPDQLYEPMPIVPELIKKEIAEHQVSDNLTDQDIIDMLAEINCKVKRIMHGETARHVWYWSHDANAQSKALEMAYKMKGVLQPKAGDNTINNFGQMLIQQKGKYDD